MSQVWARDRVKKRHLHALFPSEFLRREQVWCAVREGLQAGLRSNKPQKPKDKKEDSHYHTEDRTDLGDQKKIKEFLAGFPVSLKSAVSSGHP
jgi:hypothetical protein